MRDGRLVTVEATADGAGLASHAGTALLAQVADKLGLTRALSTRLAGIKQRRRGHDPGRVIVALAVMLADGGECVSDLGAVREQDALFGAVASDEDTGLAKLPFKAFALNEVWLATRLLHLAARVAFSGRQAKLHLPAGWPWTEALKAAFEKLNTLPALTG
ncbi:MAG TPA: transposase [Solirubrobacteraceae bacterium]|nr:transposase [Solirubrobacteraceae bacterium]